MESYSLLDLTVNGTSRARTSGPPVRSFEQLNLPVPPEPEWTSSTGQTGRCAHRDTPSSTGQITHTHSAAGCHRHPKLIYQHFDFYKQHL